MTAYIGTEQIESVIFSMNFYKKFWVVHQT